MEKIVRRLGKTNLTANQKIRIEALKLMSDMGLELPCVKKSVEVADRLVEYIKTGKISEK